MRVAVDCRYVRADHHDGISRYTTGVVTALARRHPVTMLISDPRQLGKLPPLPWFRLTAPTSPWEPLVARQLRRLAPDVVFSPMQTMGSLGRRHALVLTLHDLIYYRHRAPPPEFAWPVRALWRAYHLGWWPQRLLLDRADEVVTVSATTAALIAKHRLTRRPVTVVPNATDPVDDDSRLPRTNALVYMGSFMPYKNVDTLIRAAARLPDHELCLMSRIGDAERERLRAIAPGARLVFHDGADDDTYRAVLRRAKALVSASRDGGFGIPLAEAMSAATPVVVSDIPVHREVGGEAGVYVAPDDVDGYVRAIGALDDPGRWAELSASARRRAERYSWDASAAALLEVLERVAARRHQSR